MLDTYLDKEVLQQMYSVEGLSMSDIGKLVGCSSSKICRKLHHLEIPTRLQFKINEEVISDDAVQFLEGELLGDGSLISLESGNCYFSWHMKSEQYLLWLSEQLNSLGVKTRKIVPNINKSKLFLAPYTTYILRSMTYRCFNEIREVWYPSGIKILPKNLELTPIKVRQWFLGDGTLYRNRLKNSYSLRFCTQSFTCNEVNKLREKFFTLGIKTTIQKGPVLYIRTESLPNFYDYIGSCPNEVEPIYGYKWIKNISECRNVRNDFSNLPFLSFLN
jgi:hypothetical protein